jgi:hypothetical protein
LFSPPSFADHSDENAEDKNVTLASPPVFQGLSSFFTSSCAYAATEKISNKANNIIVKVWIL